MKHPILAAPITTLDEAKSFLTYLVDHGLSYHCEDSALDCIGHMLTGAECLSCDKRMDECYQQDWPGDLCPCGFVLELDADYLKNAIENCKEERDGLDVNVREQAVQCFQLGEEIERLEKLLSARSA